MSRTSRVMATLIALVSLAAILGTSWITAALGGPWLLVLGCIGLFLLVCAVMVGLLVRFAPHLSEAAEDQTPDGMPWPESWDRDWGSPEDSTYDRERWQS